MGNYAEFIGRLGTNAESDECYTPETEIAPLFQFMKKDKIYYEATSGVSSSILNSVKSAGFQMVGCEGKDFFKCSQKDIFDGVITNPPYSKKTEFLEHCFVLGKPFALLLPVAAVQGQKRGKMFLQNGISMLVYNRRVDFTGKGAPPFGVAWFMGNGFSEPNRLYFANN